MASATGIPEQTTAAEGRGEDEPLLGRAGDASQQDGKGIQFNFVLGMGLGSKLTNARVLPLSQVPRSLLKSGYGLSVSAPQLSQR